MNIRKNLLNDIRNTVNTEDAADLVEDFFDDLRTDISQIQYLLEVKSLDDLQYIADAANSLTDLQNEIR